MVFIVFEGGEGVGKTTQLEILYTALQKAGIDCLKTREPGGTPLSENIRELFKKIPAHQDVPTPFTELMLVMAARTQHLEKVIYPALTAKKVVLCDRFLDSTYVYQSILGNISKEIIDAIGKIILGNFIPDLTLVFQLNAQDAKQRILGNRQQGIDRFDDLNDSTQAKILAGFKTIVQEGYTYPSGKLPNRIIVDGMQSITAMATQIYKEVTEVIGKSA